MLVLTRKTQEQIHIGDNITISILKLKGNAVRIGIEAPRDVRVLRGELPTFDETAIEVEASDATTASATAEQTDDETAVSEPDWEVLKKLADREPCQPVRSCLPKQKVAAPLAALVRSRFDATIIDDSHVTAAND